MFTSIRTRILFFSIALLVASLGVVGAVSYVIVKADNDHAIDESSRSIADGYASAINEWVAAKASMAAAAADGVLQADPVFVIKQLQKSGGFYVTTFGKEDKTAYTSAAEGLPAGYDPTDMTELSDGRLLILNRRLNLSFALFTAKLVIVDRTAIREGATVEGREVATLAPPFLHDNFEALAATQEQGATIVWIASDDNREWFEQSLLLKFRLNE